MVNWWLLGTADSCSCNEKISNDQRSAKEIWLYEQFTSLSAWTPTKQHMQWYRDRCLCYTWIDELKLPAHRSLYTSTRPGISFWSQYTSNSSNIEEKHYFLADTVDRINFQLWTSNILPGFLLCSMNQRKIPFKHTTVLSYDVTVGHKN